MAEEGHVTTRELTPEEAIQHLQAAFRQQGWPKDSGDMRACLLTLAGAVSSLANAVEHIRDNGSPDEIERFLNHARRSAGAVVGLALGIAPDGE